MDNALLECKDIHKSFGGVPVLTGVSLHLAPGTVTALAGENGAGKSVLMKIISGQHHPDTGTITVNGTELTVGDPVQALRHGVAIVPQELAPVADMTVAQNLFLGREIKNRLGILDRSEMTKRSAKMLAAFGIDISPSTMMRHLSVGLCQLVEIIKCTNKGATVVLLDEPTSAISAKEVDRLYRTIDQLRDQGVAMLYTTHKMEEIRRLADRVVVLRDGTLILDSPADQISDDQIVTAMIGRELKGLFPTLAPRGDRELLTADQLQVPGASAPVAFSVRAGEILGLAGLVGAGRTELIETLFGHRKATSGVVTVNQTTLRPGRPDHAIKAGMALVPEDRKGAGAILSMTVAENGSIPHLKMFTTVGVIRNKRRASVVGKAMASVRLKSKGLRQPVGTLSGGNQQKVVLARWFTDTVSVLLLDEPTRGVDVGARSEIYQIISDLAASGMAVVMASSDMPEILSLCHRSLIMRAGAIVGELDEQELRREDAAERIFRMATGLSFVDNPSSHDEGNRP